MPSVSSGQQQAMGRAYAYKCKGKGKPLWGSSKEMAASMTCKQLRDFAATKTKNLPEKKAQVDETRLQSLLRGALSGGVTGGTTGGIAGGLLGGTGLARSRLARLGLGMSSKNRLLGIIAMALFGAGIGGVSGAHIGAISRSAAPRNNKGREKKGALMNTEITAQELEYLEGFMNKCAAAGVDPIMMIEKDAGIADIARRLLPAALRAAKGAKRISLAMLKKLMSNAKGIRGATGSAARGQGIRKGVDKVKGLARSTGNFIRNNKSNLAVIGGGSAAGLGGGYVLSRQAKNNKGREKKGALMNTEITAQELEYLEGFMNKCAAAGVDPIMMIEKDAGIADIARRLLPAALRAAKGAKRISLATLKKLMSNAKGVRTGVKAKPSPALLQYLNKLLGRKAAPGVAAGKGIRKGIDKATGAARATGKAISKNRSAIAAGGVAGAGAGAGAGALTRKKEAGAISEELTDSEMSYFKGFTDKCAELNVDPDVLFEFGKEGQAANPMVGELTTPTSLAGKWWKNNGPGMIDKTKANPLNPMVGELTTPTSLAGKWWKNNGPGMIDKIKANPLTRGCIAGKWWKNNGPGMIDKIKANPLTRGFIAGKWWKNNGPGMIDKIKANALTRGLIGAGGAGAGVARSRLLRRK